MLEIWNYVINPSRHMDNILKVKGRHLYTATYKLHEHDQQRFTMRSGVLTGNDTRWRSASSGSPLPEGTDFGPRSLQL